MKSLLIVEDEKLIRRGISSIVKRAPVEIGEVIECRNGAEAMEILTGRHIDVMLTDIRMPKMDGLELVRRAMELPSPPVIFVISGHSDFSYAVSAFRRGVRDYITKPLNRNEIYGILEKLQAEFDEKERAAEDSRAAQAGAPYPDDVSPERGYGQKIADAIEFIGANFADDVDMAIVSNHVSMNYTQFSSYFKKCTGKKFQNYLLDVRLAESMRLLADQPALSVKDVSEASGFKNAKHFMRCFKRKTGVSPSAYRHNSLNKTRT